MRKLTALDKKRTHPDGHVEDYCELEDELLKLLARQRRVPSVMVKADGFPPGGGDGVRGAAQNTTTEAAALADQPNEAGIQPKIEVDTLGPLVTTIVVMLAQAGTGATTARTRILTGMQQAKWTKPSGHRVDMCTTVGGADSVHEIPCGEIAVRGGLCEGCRKRLRELNTRREEQGLDRLSALPKAEADELFTNRGKRRTYETGPYAEPAGHVGQGM
jgi:hypothetical protein